MSGSDMRGVYLIDLTLNEELAKLLGVDVGPIS